MFLPSISQQLLFFNMPLTCYLCWSLHLRSRGNSFRSHFLRPGYRWKTLGVHTAMSLLLAWQGYSCYFLLETYGPLAFFLSPVRTWAVGIALLLVYRAWKGPAPSPWRQQDNHSLLTVALTFYWAILLVMANYIGSLLFYPIFQSTLLCKVVSHSPFKATFPSWSYFPHF